MRVIRNKGCIGLCLFNNWMPTGHNMNRCAGIYLRAAVVPTCSHMCQAEINIQFRQRPRRCQDALSIVNRQIGTQLGKEFLLQFCTLLLSIEDQSLILFEVWRNETLASRKRLLANIISRNTAKLRVRHLEIIAKNFVIADL